jgi:hypothetical protein
MPRYKLANNDDLWNTLSSLCSLHPEVKRKSVELMKVSTSRKQVYESIVKLSDGQEDFNWDILFDN